MNTVDDLNARYDVAESDRCIALSSLSFDLSVYDIFGMLAAGGAIVIPPAESVSPPDPGRWLELVEQESITLWNTVPAFVQLLVNFVGHTADRLPKSHLMYGLIIPAKNHSKLQMFYSPSGRKT